MKEIVIITNGTLPVPAVKGGAAENLLQTFLKYNDLYNDFKIVVFSIKDEKAVELSKKYKNTKFVHINSKSIFYKIGRAVRFFLNRSKLFKVKNQFIYSVTKSKETLNNTDLILIECNPNYASFLKTKTNKPIGLHLHNDYLNIDYKIESKRKVKHLDFVICVSKYIQNRVKIIFPKKDKVSFVYNGIDLKRFHEINLDENKRLKEKFKIKSDEKVIIFTGRIQESKGIMLLMEVFLEVSKNHNIKLLIIGASVFEGSKKTKFIKDLESLSEKVADKIIFTGYVDYSEIHNYYHLADFCVLPSLATEALALTSLEALASSLPVILTDAGGMPETITSKCGFVLKRDSEIKNELTKAIKRLLTDSLLLEKMTLEAKERSLLFSSENYYKAFRKELKLLL